MKKTIFTTFIFLISINISFSQSKVEDIKEFKLDNGMKILVLEDFSIPNANMYLFWKVGSRNEYPGITGLSHFFEHMMFNGSEKYGPKMFDKTMESVGGSNNAYTTENLTVYTNWFPVSSMETIFDLESDRIGKLKIDPKMVESERGVVLSERSTGLENSNFRNLSEQVKSVAFMAHPYRWSVIGYESDIKNWSINDLQMYFDTYYSPNNATVVISGAVKFENVKKLALKYFGPLVNKISPRKIHTVEPKQNGEKIIVVKKQVSTPNIMLAYHVPESKHEDYYALDLLSSILSDGKSSRFYSILIDQNQKATSAFSYYPESIDPNLFYIYSVTTPETEPEELEIMIQNIIDDIAKNGVSENELQKVKNQKLVGLYNTLETINGKSNTIGTYEMYFGDYKKMFSAPEEYQNVTNSDIKRVAKKYFIKDNRTVGFLIPPTK